MAKKKKPGTGTFLLIGGLGLASVWLLSRNGQQGGDPGSTILGGLGGGSGLPLNFNLPTPSITIGSGEGGLFDKIRTSLNDFLSGLPDASLYREGSDSPQDPDAGNYPPTSTLKPIPDQYSDASFYQDLGLKAGGIAARQYMSELLIGKHLVKPLPFAKKVRQIGVLGRETTEQVVKRAVPTLTKITAKPAGRTAGKIALRTIPKVGAKAASRAIPVVGWGMMLADVGADVARLFGADVTEWLGFSSLAEPVIGYNPLERWVSQSGGIWPWSKEVGREPEVITRAPVLQQLAATPARRAAVSTQIPSWVEEHWGGSGIPGSTGGAYWSDPGPVTVRETPSSPTANTDARGVPVEMLNLPGRWGYKSLTGGL